MERDPRLASYGYTSEGKATSRLRFHVYGGLHHIKGNRKPYFSITASGYDDGSEFGGCAHDTILSKFPKFADLVALHLSDIDGVPSHDGGNAFYFLGGCRRPNEIVNYPAANYTHAANYLRITEDEARKLVADLFGDHYSETAGFMSRTSQRAAELRLMEWVQTQKPRWKAEALACIEKHKLVVYGDKWEG